MLKGGEFQFLDRDFRKSRLVALRQTQLCIHLHRSNTLVSQNFCLTISKTINITKLQPWLEPNKPLVNPPEERLLASNWLPRPLANRPLPQEESKSPTGECQRKNELAELNISIE
jgi:hypothetical protein